MLRLAWEQIEGGANAKGISAYLSKGTDANAHKQAEALISFTNDARSFFAGLFGSNVDAPLRLVSVSRGGGFDNAGTILLGEASFSRAKVDSATALSIAEAVARLWIGRDRPGAAEGHGVVGGGVVRLSRA